MLGLCGPLRSQASLLKERKSTIFTFKSSNDDHAPQRGGSKEQPLRTAGVPRFGAHWLRWLGAGGSVLLLSLFTLVGVTPALALVGQVTEFPVAQGFPGTPGFPGNAMARGSDGNVWFSTNTPVTIGRITPAGQVTQFADPNTSATFAADFTLGSDGNVWFLDVTGFNPSQERIGRVTPAGQISEFLILTFKGNLASVNQMTLGSDGNIWFTANTFSSRHLSNGFIGRVTTAGVISEFGTPTAVSDPQDIALGSDGNIWFNEVSAHAVGRILTH